MSYFEAIILGIIQGITEFFPISSSGHLLIARKIFSIDSMNLFIEVFLHTGTLISILLYWRKEIISKIENSFNGDLKYLYKIGIATIPAGIVGLFFKEKIQESFFNINSIEYLIINYSIMGFLLFITRKLNKNNDSNLSIKIALFIGFSQAIAILPGMSRSGLTICTALLLGINLKKAIEFSFILAIPILFFASVESIYSNFNLFLLQKEIIIQLFFGFISSAIIGYLVMVILVKIIYKQKFWYFSIYCFCISLFLLVYNYGI